MALGVLSAVFEVLILKKKKFLLLQLERTQLLESLVLFLLLSDIDIRR